MMKSGCHKCDSLKLLLCVKPVINVLLRHHRNKNYPLCGRVHHDYGKMTRHICPGRVPVEVWGLEEAERLSGLLGHSNIKCKGMKHWWPSSPFSCKTRRNIKLSLKYMTQRWLFVCSSSVLTSHVRLCCCSKEDTACLHFCERLCTSDWTVNRYCSPVILCPKGFLSTRNNLLAKA